MGERESLAAGATGGDLSLSELFKAEPGAQKDKQAARIAARGKSAVPLLIDALHCEDPEKIAAIVVVLVKIGKPAVTALVRELGNSNQYVQGAAINALATIGRDAAGPVLSAIAKGNQIVVGAGSATIRQMGEAAIPALKLASDPKNARHSNQAVNLLIELDAQASTTLTDYLKDGLGSDDQFMAGAAINAFTNMGRGAVPQLVGFLEDANPYVQQNTMTAIANIGEASVPELLKALGAESQLLQQNAYNALKRIGKPAIPGLLKAVNSDEPVLTYNARRLLMELGTNPEKKMGGWWKRR